MHAATVMFSAAWCLCRDLWGWQTTVSAAISAGRVGQHMKPGDRCECTRAHVCVHMCLCVSVCVYVCVCVDARCGSRETDAARARRMAEEVLRDTRLKPARRANRMMTAAELMARAARTAEETGELIRTERRCHVRRTMFAAETEEEPEEEHKQLQRLLCVRQQLAAFRWANDSRSIDWPLLTLQH
eukprot:GHVU01098579.1.p1 GENE.GHVU01098579.1~~GHVU01098579.1.p1  ORF type:complete len:186 (+),score=21.98 GHVU01098579.1:338-895(+)